MASEVLNEEIDTQCSWYSLGILDVAKRWI